MTYPTFSHKHTRIKFIQNLMKKKNEEEGDAGGSKNVCGEDCFDHYMIYYYSIFGLCCVYAAALILSKPEAIEFFIFN